MAIRKSKKLNTIITDKKKVTFDYVDRKGVPSSRRGEIHTMGYDKKGHSALRVYDNVKNEWRMFHSSSVSNLKAEKESYRYTKPGFNPNDRGMKAVVKSTSLKPKKRPAKRK